MKLTSTQRGDVVTMRLEEATPHSATQELPQWARGMDSRRVIQIPDAYWDFAVPTLVKSRLRWAANILGIAIRESVRVPEQAEWITLPVKDFAMRCGVTPPTMEKSLRALCERNYLEVRESARGDGLRDYRVNLAGLAGGAQ
jgi:hypothetical protein